MGQDSKLSARYPKWVEGLSTIAAQRQESYLGFCVHSHRRFHCFDFFSSSLARWIGVFSFHREG